MKISIENFKSIKKIHNYELKPLTILSGINSAGKSSFVQLLLLLKQTIEDSSSNRVLSTKGEYYNLGNINDVVNKSNKNDLITVGFNFQKSEFTDINFPKLGIDDYLIDLLISFSCNDDKIQISKFEIKLKSDLLEKENYLTVDLIENNLYRVSSDSELYGKNLFYNPIETKIDFVAFYPLSYLFDEEKFIFNLDWLKESINLFLSSISYVGPNRIEPQETYYFKNLSENVGKSGEFVSQILKERANIEVNYQKLNFYEEGVKFQALSENLLSAVAYWMCTIFDVASDIYSEKNDDSYKIILSYKNGLKVNIKHVGYGISQLLPIIVQGLLLPKQSTFIVEQPEVHLHPKIQSLLYDFFYGLTLDGKKVVVETHSSHFITRMRRRIAEDENNDMHKKISLTFIEDVFKTLEFSDNGVLNYYPLDFIEPSNTELRAIVKAQTRKMKKNG